MNPTAEAGVLVIGDGFLANLRPVRHYSERVCFMASIIFNSILAVLLVREKNQTLKPYSRVLLINVGADLFYTVMCMLVEMDLELNSGVYIWAINGCIKECSPEVQKLAMSLWIVSCCAACLVSTIEFIFRYFLVVKHYTLKYWQLLLCVCIILACGSFDAMWFYMAMNSVEDHAAEFGHLMTHPMWHEGGSILYYGADIVFSLVSVAVIPIACMMPLLFFKVRYAGAGLVITLLLQYIPGVNPVTTILLVGPYRRKLFGKFCRRAWTVDAVNSSAHSRPRQASESRNSHSSLRANAATTAAQLDLSHI